MKKKILLKLLGKNDKYIKLRKMLGASSGLEDFDILTWRVLYSPGRSTGKFSVV